ncbi:LOB domain-containing protein 40-like [Chenopodium quinoa]|uniref:LOB domain-containing protein 40-like n=1 Tax=Chenopodium quinoa TaxID=63459 RepID=UPI000B78B973|nr:LOB domain-containing protein 40-like [Chenopodium quinoa]
MRMSCNGCRVLRKGCSEDCSIRPCLQWIKSPESQANATVFLAKFYGRAGLMNLINAGPDHLRPAIFRSLLYEACGRMVNPIYGSVGLLWSGQWQLCQTAIEAVLKGAPITPIPTEAAPNSPPIQGAYDIRHVSKDEHAHSNNSSAAAGLHRVKPTRTRFKRVGSKSKPASKAESAAGGAATSALQVMAVAESTRPDSAEFNGSSTSHDSTVSHPDDPGSTTHTSLVSTDVMVDAAEEVVVERGSVRHDGDDDGEVELELTLGFGWPSQ